jgi:AAA15 family ATPase/GTPase
MRAVASYKEHPYNLIGENNGNALLKVVSIYGANASGKSNFVDAYGYFRQLVRDSFVKNNKDQDESVLESFFYPFFFDEESFENDTEFEATYHLGENEYRYGFVYTPKCIKYEWLYKRSLSTGRQSRIIERVGNKIELGSSVKKSCEKYLDDIDADVLALSFLSSLKLKTHVFTETAYCISDILPLSFAREDQTESMIDRYFEKDFDEEEKPHLLSFLKGIDVGIKDIEVSKNKDKIAITTFHKGVSGELYPMDFDIESDGTRRAIAIYSLVRIAALYGKGLMLDEFNSQLHPLLQKYIVDLFYEANTEGQLIYTTHDTTLLDKQFMRRDQIWFVSKDEEGKSSLYSLADFKIRNDKSFGKDYLGGIYGAIPILNKFSFQEA